MNKFIAVPLSIVTAILTLVVIFAGGLGFLWCISWIGAGIGFLIGLAPSSSGIVMAVILSIVFAIALVAIITDIAMTQYKYFTNK